MRLIALLSIPLLASTAHAEKNGGSSGGGGGALGGVSAGIGGASGSGGYGAQPSSGNVDRTDTGGIAAVCYDGNGRVIDEHDTDECYEPRINHFGNAVLVKRKRVEPPAPRAHASFYLGAQKVHDSDGAGTLDILITDNRFLLRGSASRYYERQAGMDPLTMTLPTLTAGVRVADGATTVDFEGGVALVRTNNDRMGDSKLTGGIAGMRVEHALDRSISLVGDVQQMWFDNEIRATGGRIGARYKYLEAGFRVLDFNVGPALYGPEVGVRF